MAKYMVGTEYYICGIQLFELLGKVRFFSWVGRAGASGGRVISESEHQKGKVIPLCKLFKGRVTHLFQNFYGQVAQKHW